MRTNTICALCAVLALWQATPAAAAARVVASVQGPMQGMLPRYRGHVGHPTVRYTATLNTGAATFRLLHWVDADQSHAPKVLPLEGLIGLSRPTPQNWYAQGFLRLFVGNEQIGETPVKSVRVSEDGERGAVVFDWERKEGTWRVTFVALPMGKSLFCSVRYFPAGDPVDWRIRLANYPAGATRDGEREIATAQRKVKQVAKAQLSIADEWWVAYYDNVHEYGKPKSEGPSALVYAPEDVKACDVQVGSYAVTTILRPSGREVRMILWDSFFGMKNAEAVAYMRRTADAQLAALRGMKFVHRSVFSDEWRKRRTEIATLLEAMGNPAKESKQAADLHRILAERVQRLRKTSDQATPSDEVELVQELKQQQDLLWRLRWDELLRD